MLVTNLFFFIDQHQCRDAAQLEQVPFLAIHVRDFVPGVRQTNIREFVLFPIMTKGVAPIRADTDDFRVTRGEGRILVAQAREMGAAEGSHESAQEDQHDIFLAREARKPDGIAFEIGQFKIGSNGEDFHGLIPFKNSRTACMNSSGFSSWGT